MILGRFVASFVDENSTWKDVSPSTRLKMENFVLRVAISVLTLVLLVESVKGRFLGNRDVETPDIVKTCRKGCDIKFPLKADDLNHDNSMCWDYCLLLHIDRKKKVIITSICYDTYCVSVSFSPSVNRLDNSNLFFN